jgi:CubicO group peptidase (beta-lactamase class C family)
MTADPLAEPAAEFMELERKGCDGSTPIPMFEKVIRVLCVATFVIIFDLCPLGANPVAAQTSAAPLSAGPHFREDGPNADEFGRKEGYPSCKGLAYIQETRCRVGALSHYDALFPARTIAAPKQASELTRTTTEPIIRYSFAGINLTLDDYLNRNPVTGLLIARETTILLERYQYGRSDTDRLTSFSMAKSIVGLLIGIALKEGAIRSLDDRAEAYVPGLRDTEYGRTPIKALLLMSSGVTFSEDYANATSDIYTLAHLTLEQDPGGSLAALKRLNMRRAAPGAQFSYSSAETLVLGLVLTAATQRTLSDYASEKLWQPLGAEANATWIIDATGQEIAFAYVNAVLRDWARLGLMLANSGNWFGKAVVAEDWLTASATSAIPTTSPEVKYGYQVWFSEDTKRFSLRGLRGQFIFVDPDSKLVLVQTALSSSDSQRNELFALWTALRTQLR